MFRNLVVVLSLMALIWLGCAQDAEPCRSFEPSYCSDGVWHTCDAAPNEATGTWKTQRCGEQSICRDDDGCKAVICDVGETSCNDDMTAKAICADYGTAWRYEQCPGVCLDGTCRSQACTPDTRQCRAGTNTVLECKFPGVEWTEVEKCAAGKACQDGECRDVVCKAMQTRCFDSSVVERCLDSGTGWVATRCESFEICLESKCQQVICDPDEIRCSPNFKDIEKCNEFGTKWISVSTCDGNNACSEESLQCQPIICEAGKFGCSPDYRVQRRCSPSGTGWDIEIECSEKKACHLGSCYPITCEAGTTFCGKVPSEVMQCNESGTVSELAFTCTEDQSCNGGQCIDAWSPLGELVELGASSGTVSITPGKYALAVFNLSSSTGTMTFPLRATGNILTTKSAPTLPDDDELPWMPLPKVLPVPPLPDVPPKVVTNQAPMALPSVGDKRYFHMAGSYGRTVRVEAELRAQEAGFHIWEDTNSSASGTRMTETSLNKMVGLIKSRVLPRVTGLYGQPTDVDGNGRVDFFFTPKLPSDSAAAYVWPINFYSNIYGMSDYDYGEIVYSLPPTGLYQHDYVASVVAHELSHLVAIGNRIAPWLSNPTNIPDCKIQSELYVEEGLAELGASYTGLNDMYFARFALSRPHMWRLEAFLTNNYYNDYDAGVVHYGLGSIVLAFLMQQSGGLEVDHLGRIIDHGGRTYLQSIISGDCGQTRLNSPSNPRLSFPNWWKDLAGAMLMTTLQAPGVLGSRTTPDHLKFEGATPDPLFDGDNGIPLYGSGTVSNLKRKNWSDRPTSMLKGGISFLTMQVGDGGAELRVTDNQSGVYIVRIAE